MPQTCTRSQSLAQNLLRNLLQTLPKRAPYLPHQEKSFPKLAPAKRNLPILAANFNFLAPHLRHQAPDPHFCLDAQVFFFFFLKFSPWDKFGAVVGRPLSANTCLKRAADTPHLRQLASTQLFVLLQPSLTPLWIFKHHLLFLTTCACTFSQTNHVQDHGRRRNKHSHCSDHVQDHGRSIHTNTLLAQTALKMTLCRYMCPGIHVHCACTFNTQTKLAHVRQLDSTAPGSPSTTTVQHFEALSLHVHDEAFSSIYRARVTPASRRSPRHGPIFFPLTFRTLGGTHSVSKRDWECI